MHIMMIWIEKNRVRLLERQRDMECKVHQYQDGKPVQEVHNSRLFQLSVLVQNQPDFASWVTFARNFGPPVFHLD